MKNVYAKSLVTVVFMLLFCLGMFIVKRYYRPSGTTIMYTEDKNRSRLTAIYPAEVSHAVITHIKRWASHAVQKSGNLAGMLKLKFANGISCRLHATGHNLEIIAYRSDNDSAALASLKGEFKTIREVVLGKADELRIHED